MKVAPVTLDGVRVRMEPLDPAKHWEGLLAIAIEPELWKWTQSKIRKPEDLRRYVDTAMEEMASGRSLPFATIDNVSGRVAGSTRFSSIDARNRRVEIGWTWLGKPFQRSHINTEAKYLMMSHAFETLGCVRVELKTHVKNEKSRNAMKRIGCVEEGVFRKHSIDDDGEWRDTVYFSVLDTEWPAVKARLEGMMGRGAEVSR